MRYGLYHLPTRSFVGFSVSANSPDAECDDVSFTLETYPTDTVWLVRNWYHAAWVREHGTDWYNAGYDTPINTIKAKDLVVAEFNEDKLIPVGLQLPSIEDVITETHRDDPCLPYLLKQCTQYSLYQLRMYYQITGKDTK